MPHHEHHPIYGALCLLARGEACGVHLELGVVPGDPLPILVCFMYGSATSSHHQSSPRLSIETSEGCQGWTGYLLSLYLRMTSGRKGGLKVVCE